jgi:hypothetical protein
MRSKASQFALVSAAFACCISANAQFGPPPAAQPGLAHRIDLPGDAPVALVGDEWGGSGATIRGSAYQLDVRMSLSLRNTSGRRIRGITMAVTAQEAAPGGKASISIPSLDIAPSMDPTVSSPAAACSYGSSKRVATANIYEPYWSRAATGRCKTKCWRIWDAKPIGLSTACRP